MRRRTRIAVVATATAGATAAGVAYAAWTAVGTGSGKATAITAATSTVTGAAASAELWPGGGQIGDVSFTLDNPNPYPVSFTEITAMSVTSDDPLNCPSSSVSVPAATPAAPYAIPAVARVAGAAAAPQTIANLVSMSAAAPDGCQGASFTVTLSLRGAQTP